MDDAADDRAAHCPPTLRVAGHDRAWRAGEVLGFDDSFRHQVWNGCDGPDGWRAVFQVVIAHPHVSLEDDDDEVLSELLG